MKRLIISVVCLLLAVFLAVFGYCSLRHMSLALETQAEEISTALENGKYRIFSHFGRSTKRCSAHLSTTKKWSEPKFLYRSWRKRPTRATTRICRMNLWRYKRIFPICLTRKPPNLKIFFKIIEKIVRRDYSFPCPPETSELSFFTNYIYHFCITFLIPSIDFFYTRYGNITLI